MADVERTQDASEGRMDARHRELLKDPEYAALSPSEQADYQAYEARERLRAQVPALPAATSPAPPPGTSLQMDVTGPARPRVPLIPGSEKLGLEPITLPRSPVPADWYQKHVPYQAAQRGIASALTAPSQFGDFLANRLVPRQVGEANTAAAVRPIAEAVGQAVVPETAAGALGTAGMMLVPGGLVAKTLGSAAGAGLGAYSEGQNPLSAAGLAAGASGLFHGAGKIASAIPSAARNLVAPAVGAGTGYLLGKDARSTIEGMILGRLAAGRGGAAVGAGKSAAEDLTGAKASRFLGESYEKAGLPSIGKTPAAQREAAGGPFKASMKEAKETGIQDLEDRLGQHSFVRLPGITNPMTGTDQYTLRDANGVLSQIGKLRYTDPTGGMAQRYREVNGAIMASLDAADNAVGSPTRSAADFQQIQKTYREGLAGKKGLEGIVNAQMIDKGVIKANASAMQKSWTSPKQAEYISERIGADRHAEIAKGLGRIARGEPLGDTANALHSAYLLAGQILGNVPRSVAAGKAEDVTQGVR